MEMLLANSDYFNTLPKYLQESIMQCGVGFQDDMELRKFISAIESNE